MKSEWNWNMELALCLSLDKTCILSCILVNIYQNLGNDEKLIKIRFIKSLLCGCCDQAEAA